MSRSGLDTAGNLAGLNGGDATGDAGDGFINIIGSAFNDVLRGSNGGNTIDGGAGNDAIYGGGVISLDVSIGGGFEDTLSGGAGDDTIFDGRGDDLLDGGPGNDTLLYGGFTGVTVNLSITTQQDTGSAGKDMISGFENLIGTVSNDTLTGDRGKNSIQGNLGDDVISGAAGNDVLDGGLGGSDTVDYSYLGAASGITETLGHLKVATGAVVQTKTSGVMGDIDKIDNFENVVGGGGNDVLTGNAGANILQGGNGDDMLMGGLGSDTLIGGAGNDLFRFHHQTEGGDTILDFNNTTEADKISIVKSGFGIAGKVSLTGTGSHDFATHYFVAGTTPTEAHGQFLFNAASHQLFWDSDGTGAHAAVIIATLAVGVTLHASDFELK